MTCHFDPPEPLDAVSSVDRSPERQPSQEPQRSLSTASVVDRTAARTVAVKDTPDSGRKLRLDESPLRMFSNI